MLPDFLVFVHICHTSILQMIKQILISDQDIESKCLEPEQLHLVLKQRKMAITTNHRYKKNVVIEKLNKLASNSEEKSAS